MSTLRTSIAYVIGNWKAPVPLTRSFCIGNLFIIDRELAPGVLGVVWDVKERIIPVNDEIVAAFDELGCLAQFWQGYQNEKSLRETINASVDLALIEALVKLNSYIDLECKTFADTFKLKGWVSKLLIQERARNA